MRFALNGCGRIGRQVLRRALATPGLEPVAVNDRVSAEVLARSLRRDTLHGPWPGKIEAEGDDVLLLDGRRVRVSRVPEPGRCPWSELGVGWVVEASGRFLHREGAEGHLRAGAEGVLVTAPLEDAGQADLTLVPGINDEALELASPKVLSLASCTTLCAAPVLEALHRAWGVASTHLTTVHAYTGDQPLLDGLHEDPRRARAAALNVVPTTTRAEEALQEVLPWTRERLRAVSYRVPVALGSLVECVCRLERAPASEGAVVERLREAADGRTLEVCDEPIASADVVGCEVSALVDGALTRLLEGDHLKVVAWYDNETAYAARVVEVLAAMARRGG